MTGGANCCVNFAADGGAESCRLLTHSEPPSGSLVTGSIGRELRRGEDSVREGSGLWAAAFNLVVRRFCGYDCTEIVQRQSPRKCQVCGKFKARGKTKTRRPKVLI